MHHTLQRCFEFYYTPLSIKQLGQNFSPICQRRDVDGITCKGDTLFSEDFLHIHDLFNCIVFFLP